jgi:hypothetical protein
MPGITDSCGSIGSVANAAAAANASFFAAGALFLKHGYLPTFFDFVAQHFLDQLEAYKRRYSNSALASTEYKKRIENVVNLIRRGKTTWDNDMPKTTQGDREGEHGASRTPAVASLHRRFAMTLGRLQRVMMTS